MALVPRSSLRSLVLLMSHGKPRLSYFFSSAASSTPQTAPGGDCSATDPPAAPVRPSSSCRSTPLECPEGTIEHVTDRPSTRVLEDPRYPSPAGLYSTLQPAIDGPLSHTFEDPKQDVTQDPKGSSNTLKPETDKPSPGIIIDPSNPIAEGSPSTPVTDKPSPHGSVDGPQKDPPHHVPDDP